MKEQIKVRLDYEVIREPRYNSFLGIMQNPIVKRQFKLSVYNTTVKISSGITKSFADFMRNRGAQVRLENNTAYIVIIFAQEKEGIRKLFEAWRHKELHLLLEQAR